MRSIHKLIAGLIAVSIAMEKTAQKFKRTALVIKKSGSHTAPKKHKVARPKGNNYQSKMKVKPNTVRKNHQTRRQ